MSTSPKDNFSSWVMFVLGALSLAVGFSKLYRFAVTGDVFHRHSRSVPFDLAGSDAAMVYCAYFLIGAFLLGAGIRGLLRK